MKMMWVLFQDNYMHGVKETEHDFILIEGTKKEAVEKFKQRFGFDPLEITCDICENHYSTEEGQSMEQTTGYIRNCKFDKNTCLYIEEPRDQLYENDVFDYLTLEEFLILCDVLIIK
jgi:hypothetical protein